MKKTNSFLRECKIPGLQKLFRTMRLTIFLLLISVINVFASKTYSQTKVLNLNMKNCTVKEVLHSIEAQSEFYFMYSEKLVDVKRKVSVNIKNKKINDVLDNLFAGTNVSYKIKDRFILLTTPEVIGNDLTILPQSTVSGKVSDSGGQPLPGVTVVIKGTTQGTITDADGNYSLSDVPSNATIVFSFVGLETQEISLNGRSVVNITLSENTIGLDEVVAIGYGTMRKSDLTGSVAQVKEKDLKQVNALGLNQAFQGRLAGVQVTQNSAAPGGGVNVQIRGTNTINGGNGPLYVIDGFPIEYSNNDGGSGTPAGGGARQSTTFNPLATLNMNDIESIEVLKDASATAIYGSRGANGVVLVTTKKGKSGTSRVTYDAYYGIQKVTKTYDLLNAREYAELVNEGWENAGQAAIFGVISGYPSPETLGEGVDWQDQIFRVAPVQNHQLSFAGGNNKARHYFSVGYYDQDGILKGSDLRRGSIRVNLDGNHNSWITYGANLTFTHTESDLAQTEDDRVQDTAGPLMAALFMSPHYSTKPDEEGLYQWNDIPNTARMDNPLSLIYNNEDHLTNDRLLGNIYTNFQIFEGFDLKISYGTNIINARRDIYYPSNSRSGATYNGNAIQSRTYNLSWLNENTLNYNKTFNKLHKLNLVGGYSLQGFYYRDLKVQRINFPSDNIKDNLSNGIDELNPPSSGKSKRTLASFYGRVNYNYNDKYLFTFTSRADGSSSFGENNKWAFFPSAALAWRAANEPFINNLNFFSNLKFRYSYGTSGNSGRSYQSLAKLYGANYVLGDTQEVVPGMYPGGITNKDLKWEITTTSDFGVDMGFLKNRLSFTSDYYYKKSTDLLLNITIPSSSGFSTIYTNAGSIENRGFEFVVNAIPLDNKFRWELSANISYNRNKVLDLAGRDEFFFSVGGFGVNGTLVKVGEPTGQWVELEWDEIFHNEEELLAGPVTGSDTSVGDARYVDQNGDGFINDKDRVVVGNPNPDFIYGFSNNFSYKDFELNIFIQGVQGADVLNMTKFQLMQSEGYTNQLKEVLDRWTPTNTNTDIPRASIDRSGIVVSSNNVEDGSFMRLKNVTLAYNLKKIKFMENARIYISGTNLLTLTKYTGYDPEVSANAGKLSRNIDRFSYPMNRTYLLGVTLNF